MHYRINIYLEHEQMNTKQLKEEIRAGAYAWPGGYPKFAVTSDGECLCCACVVKEYKQILYAVKHQLRDGWRVDWFDINWEDQDLYCDNCNAHIESAYGE